MFTRIATSLQVDELLVRIDIEAAAHNTFALFANTTIADEQKAQLEALGYTIKNIDHDLMINWSEPTNHVGTAYSADTMLKKSKS